MNEDLINKWSFMLMGIDKKMLKSRYAKIYERSVLNNDFSYFKLVVPILFRLFSKKEMKSSTSKKNRIEIGREYEEALFDQGIILIDAFEHFINKCASNIEGVDKISFLKINKEEQQLVVYIVY